MIKDELLALAAHQLRTPATAVKQYLVMALEGYGEPLTDKQRQLVKKAYENNERQLRTIHEMLCVANADAGNLRLTLRRTDIANLVRQTVDEHYAQLKEKQHKLIQALPSKPLYCRVDELFLNIAISNLISNAIKYTPGGGTITVEVAGKLKYIYIAVRDNGVGIAKKELPEIFKKFVRIDNALSSKVIGSGLGLYLAHKVAELHNGRIQVSSKEHEGSAFIIILPRRQHIGTHGKKNYSPLAAPRYNQT